MKSIFPALISFPMPKRVESPSSINTFKQCQRKYYYQYIEKLPTLPNIHQLRGNVAHATLEKFYELDHSTLTSTLTENNYAQQFRTRIQTLFVNNWLHYLPQIKVLKLHPDQERFYFEETMLMLMNWVNQFIGSFEKVQKEKDISLPEIFQQLTPVREQKFVSATYSVQGFIDAIHQVEDEVHIIDYKTNASFELKDGIMLQLAIYSLLYQEKHGTRPSKVGIFFLRHKLRLMDVDEELLELAKKEIQLIHAHTAQSAALEHYPRSPGPLCKWSTGQCDFFETCKPFEQQNGKNSKEKPSSSIFG